MPSTTLSDRLVRLRTLLWCAVAAASLGAGGVLLWRALEGPALPGPRVTGDAAIVNAFSLTDHTGRAVTAESYAGRWRLVFFGYTFCPDVCPTTLATMAELLDRLGPDAARVAPLFITVDPARDTAAALADYVAAFHPGIIGLTGSQAQVDEAVASFRAFAMTAEVEDAPDGYLMNHTGYIYLMRPDGPFEAAFLAHDHTVEEFAAILSRLMAKE